MSSRLIAKYFRNKELAKKSSIKLKLSSPIKFGPLHLYRQPLMGLKSYLSGILDKPEAFKFGEYRVTWDEWERKIKSVCPIQYWFREELTFMIWSEFRALKTKWYNFKCKYFKRYNVLKINSLPPTWCDEDTLMTHAIFAVLERFMAQKPEEWADFDYEWDENSGLSKEEWDKIYEPQRQGWKDVKEAYAWWQKREEREKQLWKARENYHDLAERFDKEEDEMLLKVVKNRGFLWI